MAPDRPAHPFRRRPHHTVLALSIPVLLSMIAEPLTALVDTGFVARLGATPLAALGAAATFLSTLFWVFNFLAVGTQTEVAQAGGAGDTDRSRRAVGTAVVISGAMGLCITAVTWPFAHEAATFMKAHGDMHADCTAYLRIRLVAAPAVLLMGVGFGALRGAENMRTPVWIAVLINGLNIALDPLLIWGAGPIPALGVAGAAWASTIAHWLGAVLAVGAAMKAPGLTFALRKRVVVRLLVVGRDMVIRTACLSLFLLLAARAATGMGPERGAAHQVVRQVWTFTALLLDAFAVTGQTLIGYFVGMRRIGDARRVARVATSWCVGIGVALTAFMLAGRPWIEAWLVPPEAVAVFGAAWLMSALFQPLNALCFITDGIHWGTADYGFLRNAMLLATGAGVAGVWWIEREHASLPGEPLTWLWGLTGLWITIRAVLGAMRIWPGIGDAPLSTRTQNDRS